MTMQPYIDNRVSEDSLFDAWFALNYRLQEEAFASCINKAYLHEWLLRLWGLVAPRPQCFWLFLARITELGLFCAATYVDCCEFEAADDLLERPDPFTLRIRGKTPIAMRRQGQAPGRHTPGSRGNMEDPGGFHQRPDHPWEGNASPLLPYLFELLQGSGHMATDYLISISCRTEKIKKVAHILDDMGMVNTEEMCAKLSLMDAPRRRHFESKLCLFDRKIFNDLGRALHLFMQFGDGDSKYISKYLRP